VRASRPNGIDIAGIESVNPNRTTDMAAYDRLPMCIRMAVRDAPYPFSCLHVLHHFREHGTKETLREIAESSAAYLRACDEEKAA
jgi:hypothetical protein